MGENRTTCPGADSAPLGHGRLEGWRDRYPGKERRD